MNVPTSGYTSFGFSGSESLGGFRKELLVRLARFFLLRKERGDNAGNDS
jgi:hypothetical protein